MTTPETILQPSLHTTEKYIQLLLDELKCRGIEHESLKVEFSNGLEHKHHDEFIFEIFDLLSNAGFANAELDDTFIIMARGVELPEEYS